MQRPSEVLRLTGKRATRAGRRILVGILATLMAGSLAAGGMDPAVASAVAAAPVAASSQTTPVLRSEAPTGPEATAGAEAPASADPAAASDDSAPAGDGAAPASGAPAPAAAPAADAPAPTGTDAPTTGGLKRDISYGFGKGGSWTTTDAPQGTVLGYAGEPIDLKKTANQHFVYYPIPSTTSTSTTTYNTGYLETLSFSKWTTGTTGQLGLAIDKNGKVWSWGGNQNGQLGIGGLTGAQGGTASSGYPGLVTTLPSNLTFVQVSAGGKHALALASNGDIYAWGGLNNNGQVANTNSNGLGGSTGTPTRLSGLSNVTMVSAGYSHSGAVTASGELYMWGNQANGALGNGNSATAASPGPIQRVATGSTWKQVGVGNGSTWAVTTGGALWAWGYNLQSQLGTGDALNKATPTNTTLTNVKQVTGTGNVAFAVTTGGALYGAGTNTNIQLLNGTTTLVRNRFTLLVGSGVNEAQMGVEGAGYKTTDLAANAQSWGMGVQTGRGLANYTAAGTLGVSGSPAVPWVTETTTTTTTLTDAQATGSRIVFADASGPQSAGWALAKNITVATNNGIRYLRGDVPPHNAGPVVVWLQWNDGSNVWQNTGPYTYTIALTITTVPRPGQTTDAVSVVTGFWEPQEAAYAGASVVDVNVPELSGNPPPLLPVAGAPVSGVPWVNATAVTKVTLRPGQLPNNGPNNWLYYTSSTARVGAVPVNRNEPLGTIEFERPAAVDVHLWKTGISTSGSEVGMTGSGWKVHPDSATSPGKPDTTTTVAAFGTEVTNPNTGVPSRRQGWFNASLAPGTYWLVETKAPAGFQLMAQPVQFTVAAGGTVTLGTGKSGLTRVSNDWDSGSTFNTIVVLDPGATTLPPAGSESWAWIIYAGIALLGLGILLVFRRIVARHRSITAGV